MHSTQICKVGDGILLDYRKGQMWSRLAVSAAKAVTLFGIGIGMVSALGGVPTGQVAVVSAMQTEQGLPEATEPDAISVVAVEAFSRPTQGVLTSGFGFRNGKNHNGIDIGNECGTEIFAAAGGSVVYADWMNGYGNYLVIDHGNGYLTAYAHCMELVVGVGDSVTQGERIAFMGSTGNSTGPHLHFEIKKDGVFQDPLEYGLY